MPGYTKPGKTWHYLNEFKVKAVQLSLLDDVQVKDVANTLDIHPFMLSRWRKEYREARPIADKRYKITHMAKAGLIFHSDRGIEFTGKGFRVVLIKHNMKPSVNRLGYCTDNGYMESYFPSLKAELIRGRKFNTKPELRYALNSYINHFYNKKRLHSGTGYCSVIEYEKIAA